MTNNRFKLLVAAAILGMLLFLGLGIFIGYRMASNSYQQQLKVAQYNNEFYRIVNMELLKKAFPDSLERLNFSIDMELHRSKYLRESDTEE